MDKATIQTTINAGNSNFNVTGNMAGIDPNIIKTDSRKNSFKNINNVINNQSLLVFADFNSKHNNSNNKNSSKNNTTNQYISHSETVAFDLENKLMIKEKDAEKIINPKDKTQY